MKLHSKQKPKQRRKSKIKENIYCADFETTSKAQYLIENRTRVYLWEMKRVSDGRTYVGLSIDDFFKTIWALDSVDVECYFHNLSGFDGEFITYYLLENGYKFVSEDMLERPQDKSSYHKFTTITTDMTLTYMIKVCDFGKSVTFKCSYRLMPLSIKALGKLVGLDKLNETHDYDEIKNYTSLDDVTEEELMYIENDVEILRRILIYLYDLGLTSITMSASAFSNWKKTRYMTWKTKLSQPSDPITEQIVINSYKGGICMVNPKYQGLLLRGVKSYDYNSMYPSQMLRPMPYGQGVTREISEGQDYQQVIKELRKKGYAQFIITYVCTDATCRKGSHPFIGLTRGFSFSKSYKYERTITNTKLCLWEEEFELFMQHYDSIGVITSVTGFKEVKDLFKDYIDFWRNVKESSTGALRQIAKLMLNSLYGKFGMNVERVSKAPIGVDENGKIVWDTFDSPSNTYYAKVIASRICSMARCELVRAIEECGDDFIYCDTDSVYCFERCTPHIAISDHEFMHWKCEGRYPYAKFLKAKLYIKYDNGEKVVRSAGLPNDVAKKYLNFKTLRKGYQIIGAKHVKKRVRGGVIIDTTDFRINIEDLTYDDVG